MFWSCFGHVSVDLIKYANEYSVIVRNRTRCNKCTTRDRIGDTEGLTDFADMDTAGGTDMRCFKCRCPWNEDGQCTMTEYDELPEGGECPTTFKEDD